MPGGEHRVCLAAAEGGLQVDDGCGVLVAADALHGQSEQGLETLSEKGAGEELDRIVVVR